MTRRMKAGITVALAILLDLLWATLFAHVSHIGFGTAVYWSLGAASTEGSSIPELTGAQQLLKCLMIITDLPFVLGTYALYQSWETTERLNANILDAERRMRLHLEDRFKHYLGKDHDEQQEHDSQPGQVAG
jgi:hypothetical protein